MSITPGTRAWVEVDLDALRANFKVVRETATPARGVLPMVKADAYGVGLACAVRALEPLAPWGYGVATLDEGERVRELGVERPVVVFSPVAPGYERDGVRLGLTPVLSGPEDVRRWAAAARDAGASLDFHVEVDTGMGRVGCVWNDAADWGAAIAAECGGGVRWAGVFTHFHSADEPDGGAAATTEQRRRFQAALDALPVPRSELLVHAANSAAALRWPDTGMDLVRPGIFLYGGSVTGAPAPRPVVAVRARVGLIRDVAAGRTTGYGATHVAPAASRWGTIGLGYGDGVPRSLGNRGVLLVRGTRVPLRGRVSMDMIVVDLSGVPDAAAGDVATLIGRDGADEITLDEVAERAGTLSYEILTRLTQRLPRVEK